MSPRKGIFDMPFSWSRRPRLLDLLEERLTRPFVREGAGTPRPSCAAFEGGSRGLRCWTGYDDGGDVGRPLLPELASEVLVVDDGGLVRFGVDVEGLLDVLTSYPVVWTLANVCKHGLAPALNGGRGNSETEGVNE